MINSHLKCIQLNFNDLNTDEYHDSFPVADSSLYLSPLEILPIVKENKYLCIALVKAFFQSKSIDIFSYFSTKTYLVGTH